MNVESKNPPKLKLIMPDAYKHRMMVPKRKRETGIFCRFRKSQREKKWRDRDHDIKRRNGMRTY